MSLRLTALILITALESIAIAQNGLQTNLVLMDSLRSIRPEALQAHIEFLADDALEGRGTGSRGYDVAAKYVRAQFASLGLRSGVQDGSYFQSVALRRTEVDPLGSSLMIESGGRKNKLGYNKDYIVLDTHAHTTGSVSAPVVFAGYGVTAPEFHYDDYAGIDVKGKIVAAFEFEAPASFPATERAYYMDGDVKQQMAREHGAVGMILIRTPVEERRFPWTDLLREVKVGYNSMRWIESSDRVYGIVDGILVCADLNRSGSEALFAGESPTLAEVFDQVKNGETRSFALHKTASIRYKARHTPVSSPNVVGVLPGSDPELRKEYVVFTAHLDHLGIGPTVNGDNIYNGALDNAAGTAVMLEVARWFAAQPVAPKRSIAFVALTGEEEFLLGSTAFANQSPLDGPIVANINVDGGAETVPVKDVVAFGEEHSTLGAIARQAASLLQRELSPDPMPEEGSFIRSDQYSFVRIGVPALQLDLGFKSDQPDVDPLAVMKKWMVTIYHSPKDDASQSIHYESSARFAGYAALITFSTANDARRPEWNTGDFFGRRFAKR
jgi:hypothetical protein